MFRQTLREILRLRFVPAQNDRYCTILFKLNPYPRRTPDEQNRTNLRATPNVHPR